MSEIVFKKSSKKKKLRKKETFDLDNIEDDTKNESAVIMPVKELKKKKEKKKNKIKPSIELSFDEPENGEVFKIKKSSASRRLAKAKLNKDIYMEDVKRSPKEENLYSEKNLNALKNSSLNKPPPAQILKSQEANQRNLLNFEASKKILQNEISIPDATKIHEAKKLREARRNAKSSTKELSTLNYIPLNSTESSNDKKESDEEEDDDEGVEEIFDDYKNDRILFGTSAVKEQEKKKKKEMRINLISAQENESEDEDEDELNKWESELIKQGRAAPEIMKVAQKKSEMAKSQIPDVGSLPSLDEVVRKFSSTLYNLRLSHSENINQEAYFSEEIQKSKDNTEKLQSDLKQSSERYTYFQELRNYIIDLAEFLDEKFKKFDEIEKEYDDLNKEKAKYTINRVQTDLDDCFVDFTSGWNGMVFDQEGNIKYQYNRENKESREILRKMRTKSNKNRKIFLSELDDIEGCISNDEFDENDQKVYDSKKSEIIKKYNALFEDTNENFKSLSLIKKNFEEWKMKYPKEYNQGFGGLSLPGVFELFVKYELFLWEPLKTFTEFEEMEWHREASSYGANEMDMDNYDPDDQDNQLLIRLVEKFCIPKIKKIISYWNIYSVKEGKKLLSILSLLQDYIKSKDPNFITLTELIQNKIKENVERIIKYNPINLVTGNVNYSPHTYNQINYWFWKIFKLYHITFMFKKYIPDSELRTITIELILNQLLVPCLSIIQQIYLNNTNLKEEMLKYEKITELIPDDWFSSEEYTVVPLFKIYEVCVKGWSEACKRINSPKNLFEKIVKMLVKLSSYDEASKLAKIYNIE